MRAWARWMPLAGALGSLLFLAACGSDAPFAQQNITVISGTVTTAEGQPLEGAQVSLHYALGDSLPFYFQGGLALTPGGAELDGGSWTGPGRWSQAASLDSVSAFRARQVGLAAELMWSVDSLGAIDSFLVRKRGAGEREFRDLVRVAAAPPAVNYSWVDSLEPLSGVVAYRLFAELPGFGLAGDSLEIALAVGTQLGMPAPNPMVDTVSVAVTFFAPASYRVEVLGKLDEPLRLLGAGEAQAGEVRWFGWNGSDSLGLRPAGGVNVVAAEIVPAAGGAATLLRTPVFLNDGVDAVSDSSGFYSVTRIATGEVLRAVAADGSFVGPRAVLPTITVSAAAAGYETASEEIEVLERVNNLVDFALVAE